MIEQAPAKVNLALHVRARMPDGYHQLETIFAFARDGDTLAVAPGNELSLKITGPFGRGLGAGADNLVLRAAEALRQAAGVTRGAALTLDKRLPIASGIGGGSADAAAALRLLSRFWDISIDLMPLATALGADVPACLIGSPVRGEGRGDSLTPLPTERLTGLPLLLINPGVAMPTGPVFAGWDGADRGPLGLDDPLAAAIAGRNDLEPPAVAIYPALTELLDWLSGQPDVLLARMSGSGATCFALFRTIEAMRSAEVAAAQRWPIHWRLATALS